MSTPATQTASPRSEEKPADASLDLELAETEADVLLASAMRTVIMRLARQLRTERNDETLSFSQLAALGVIAARGPISPSQLATFERIKAPSAARIIGALVTHGYIERTKRPEDRRHALLSATAAGHQLILADRDRRTVWLATILKTLTREQRAELTAALPHLERLVQTGIEDHVAEVLQ